MAMDVTATLRAYDAGFSKGMDGAMAKLKGVSKFGGSTGGSMLKMGALFGAGSMIASKALGAITNGMGEVIHTMSDSQATWKTFDGNMAYMGKSSAQIDKVKKSLQKYAQQTIYSASDMASTYSQLAAVGVKNTTRLVKGFGGLASAADDPKQAMKTLSQQATQMAAKPMVQWGDFKLMLEQTPAGIAAVAKTMGMSTSELVKNVQDGKVKTEDFFKAIEKAGNSKTFYTMATQYKTMGQAVDGLVETLAGKLTPTFNKVSSYGIKGISSLVNYLDTVNFNALIPKIDKVANYIGNGFNKALPTLKSTWEAIKNGASAAFDGIKQIASELAPDVKALFSDIIDNFKAWVPASKSVFGTIGGVAKAAIPVLVAGVKGALKALQGLFKIMQKLAPVFKSLFENKGVQSLAVGVGSAIASYKALNKALKVTYDAFEGVKTAGKVGKTIVSSMKGVAGLKNKLTAASKALDVFANSSKIATAAQAAFNAVAAVNPYVLIAAAIVAVIAALAYFFTQTKTGRKIWADYTKFLSNSWKVIKEGAMNAWKAVTQAISNAGKGVKEAWNGVKEFFSNLWNNIKDGVSSAWQGVVDVFNGVIDGIKKAWNGVKEFFSNLWNSIVTAVQPYWDSFLTSIQPIIDAFKNLWNSLKEFFSTLWNAIVSVAQGIWQGFLNFITPIIDALKTAWDTLTEFFSNLWNGIVSAAQELWNGFVNNVVTPVVEAFKTAWNGLTEFFSTLWNGIVTFAQSVWQGFVENVVTPIVEGIKSAWNTLTDWWSSFWDTIKSIAQSIWDGIQSVISSVSNAIVNDINSFLQTVQDVWQSIWNTIKSVAQTIWNGIVAAISGAINIVASVINAITHAIQGNWSAVWNDIKNIVSIVWGGIKSVVSAQLNAIESVMNSVMNGIRSVVSGGWNSIKSIFSSSAHALAGLVHVDLSGAGRAIMNSLLSGLESAWGAVKHFVSGIAGWIKAHKGPISYDRRLLIPAGKAIMTGLNQGLNSSFSGVKKNVSSMADSLADSFTMPSFDVGAINTSFRNASAALTSSLNWEAKATNTMTIEVPVNIDGREVARVTAEPMQEELNRRNMRTQRLYGNRN